MIDSKDIIFNGTSSLKKRPRQTQENWNTLATFKDDKLVLMKFNNLAFNHSAVYETDTPDKNQIYNINREIEDINYNIQTNKSNEYFNSNISDICSQSFKIKHKFKCEYWELAAQGEKETPLQKYYRLKFEIEDLLKHGSCFQIVDENDHNEYNIYANIGFKIQNILNKLYSIDGDITFLKGYETTKNCNLQNYIVAKLLEKCLNSNGQEQFIILNNISNFLNIEVTLKVLKHNSLNTKQLLQISQLDGRLQKLEAIVGPETSILKRLAGSCNSDGLIEAIRMLKGLSKLILPQINEIESRLMYLLPRLKQIPTKLFDQSSEVDEKTNKLYEIILRAREESNLLSHVIQRMTILNIFRHKVETFAVTMNNFTSQYSKTYKTFKNNELLLKNIETHIPKNVANVVSNLQSLNTQIEVYADRLKNV